MINQRVKVNEGILKVRPSEESILHKQGLKQMFANYGEISFHMGKVEYHFL